MAIVPVRGLAEKGILRDPAPYQLDLNAFSGGANVQFHANKAQRAPIWRSVDATLAYAPVFVTALNPITGYDSIITKAADGSAFSWVSGVNTDITSATNPGTTSAHAYTSTFQSDVLYINRSGQLPEYFGPLSTVFADLPNQEEAWTCRSLRAFGNYLVALNVDKPSTGLLKNLVKWSDLILNGQVPGSWDPTDATTSAGENPLEELDTGIVDGAPLRGLFVIYSENQIWAMEQTGTSQIFSFQKLFNEGGLIAPNCMVEVDGIHYVFGPTDIYKHDGVSKISIIDRRNKDAVYRYLNKEKSENFFVHYSPKYNTIYFCYNTGDVNAVFQDADRCNYAAAYDLGADTWSFNDLPNVSGMAEASLDAILTWASAPATLTWENVGGSWYDQENSFVKHTVGVSSQMTGVTADRIAAFDYFSKGQLSFPYEPEMNAPAFLERTGIALDQVGSDLTTWKNVRTIFPLINIFNNAEVQIEVGGSATPSGPVTYSTARSFNPATQYKVDGIKGGRYLAVRFSLSGSEDFEVAGFDMDVVNAGRR